MGLDMKLSAELYIGGKYKHRGIEGEINITEQPTWFNHEKEIWEPTKEKTTFLKMTDMKTIQAIKFSVGDWRKANAIHRWFVENVQDGKDECQESYVERNKLEELLSTCRQALLIIDNSGEENGLVQNGSKLTKEGGWEPIMQEGTIYKGAEKAGELLPTTSGFGSTAYDEWYIQEIKNTIKILEDALNNPQYESCSFFYRASW